MAKKTTKKKSAAKTGGLADSAKGTAASILGEVEKAGEVILGEIKVGLGTVSGKVANTAKSVTETKAAQILKSLVDEVEEISGNLVNTVSAKLDGLRGKVEETHAADEPVKKKTVRRKKPVSKKPMAKKTITRKAASKKTTAKKATTRKAAVKKTTTKKTTSKKAAPRKTTANKKTSTKKKTTTRKAVPKKKSTTRKKSSPKT